MLYPGRWALPRGLVIEHMYSLITLALSGIYFLRSKWRHVQL